MYYEVFPILSNLFDFSNNRLKSVNLKQKRKCFFRSSTTFRDYVSCIVLWFFKLVFQNLNIVAKKIQFE